MIKVKDRVRVNGRLFEAVSDKNGKFGQIRYKDHGDVEIKITNGGQTLFDFRWNKTYKSSFYALNHDVYKYIDDFFISDDISRSTIDKIYDYVLGMDSSLTRPWTDDDAEKLSDYLESHFGYVFIDEFLDDTDPTWDTVRNFDFDWYKELVDEIIAGNESPDTLFDTCPAYDEVSREIRADSSWNG